MRRFRPRLTYANVVASLALFVALGGTTYAAATIGAGDIKKDAVRSKHIKSCTAPVACSGPPTSVLSSPCAPPPAGWAQSRHAPARNGGSRTRANSRWRLTT
jgi:hypothetical protein